MKNILKNPVVNAICISLFTAFYAIIFLASSKRQVYIACALIAITVLVVAMLLFRRRPYDEYHTARLVQCLAVALILTLIAIAVFYAMILRDPSGIVEKFTLFIVIHWSTVVLADLAYVLVCRWR